MALPSCYVCGHPECQVLYQSQGDRSLTSLCQVHPGATLVYVCGRCGHCQSDVMNDVEAYYDAEYDILVDSEEEDQIYEVVDGTPVYRTEHQVRTLLQKLPMNGAVDLLDYGCAKSSTIRTLCATSPAVTPHLFDVSARYIPFWEKFASSDHWAVNTPRPEWESHFDVVTSFFSLEHIPSPARSLAEIARLLKPGGSFYCIVPNVASNIADLIVVDHCNHFTAPSLAYLIEDAGLELREIDAHAHRGAFVLVASKPDGTARAPESDAMAQVPVVLAELAEIADFWQRAADRVREFEAALPIGEPIAVYGAGFYGAFIAANLAQPARIACFVDQNPFLQGRLLDGKPILAPADLPASIRAMLVGLNPAHARRIIDDIPTLRARQLDYFFL